MDRAVDKKLEIEAFLTDVASRKEGMVYICSTRGLEELE